MTHGDENTRRPLPVSWSEASNSDHGSDLLNAVVMHPAIKLILDSADVERHYR